jgi:hypothetical protein
MRAMAALMTLFAGLLLAGPIPAQSLRPQVKPGGGEVLVREMMTVTGLLRLVPQPAGQGSALEIDAGNLGKFRITELGLGAELKTHVDEHVTVVAFVEPFQQDGRTALRVAHFTLHDRQT